MDSIVSRSNSDSLEESRKPLAKGLLSIFSLVIWDKQSVCEGQTAVKLPTN